MLNKKHNQEEIKSNNLVLASLLCVFYTLKKQVLHCNTDITKQSMRIKTFCLNSCTITKKRKMPCTWPT